MFLIRLLYLKKINNEKKYIELKEGNDLDHVFEQKAVQLPMKAGDALFFHSHLVHRSGANVSDRSRWVFVARYGDMLDQEMVARGWTTTQGASPELLKNLYPHRVTVSKEQKWAKKAESNFSKHLTVDLSNTFVKQV